MGTLSLPSEVQVLQNELVSRGFRVADSEYYESHFGDTVILLENGDLRIRLIRDRGQWMLVIGSRDFEEWFSPTVWRDYFDGSIGSLSPPTWEQQCSMVLSELDLMRSAVLEDDNLLEHLRNYRSDRAEAKREKR